VRIGRISAAVGVIERRHMSVVKRHFRAAARSSGWAERVCMSEKVRFA